MSPIELPPSAIVVPRWMSVAFGEIGVIEDTRAGHTHPRVPQYHGVTRAGTALDDLAWCSSFWCWVMEMAGVTSTKSKTASSWATWGQPCKPVFGATAVFPKTDPDAKGSGHVGGVVGAIGELVLIVGGNQTIRHGKVRYQGVNIVPRVTAEGIYRWPDAVQLPSPRLAA